MPPIRQRLSNPCAVGVRAAGDDGTKMNDSVKKRGMEVNVSKTKVMVFEKSESTTECYIYIKDASSMFVYALSHILSGVAWTNIDVGEVASARPLFYRSQDLPNKSNLPNML
ncbi:hypothetical protein EVAR_13898_1 [Eumeta japonica]|uniref:Uncharacterized protein n=1 Tax=Eumeta variegata TaxID=151549 RepID=A0A4C1U8H0_EUMVA|nr:hypothetical protein EVAR_13898_1 [Eumeta japonica]